ncbi:MAG TPA: bacteriohopanetetrol glucosamine biosynthesis glycosyltransferase HpnI [Candidatus Polarisedimenticolia bacterium]|nr:bacteriohopanetetrol glucosamine biosynthesis glycosyltransferase HpnI [Candidatus Polarisedimenticolia bacterium]
MLLHTVYRIALVLAAAPLAYYLLSLYCVIGYFRELRKSPSLNSTYSPPVSILKPVRGVDREAYENFASYCRLDYTEYEIIFAVADPDDAAVPVVERLQTNFPACSIRLIKGAERVGTNSKVNSLCRLVQEAKYELMVMSDSDVRVDADYLKVVAPPFADPQVGAVTGFYRCITAGGVAADLDALGMYLDSAPGALVARRLEGKMQFAFGWTMATTKKHLSEIGGWEAMANYHSDDFELGNRIARRGYHVELMRKPVWMVFPQETIAQYFRHELRWSIGLKNVRPTGYRWLMLTHGLPWALLAAACAARAGWEGIAPAHLIAYLVLRLGLAWTTGTWGLGDAGAWKKLWLVPLRDAINFAAWVGGFFSERILWRGIAYRVKNGQLFPMTSTSMANEGAAQGLGAITNSENIT